MKTLWQNPLARLALATGLWASLPLAISYTDSISGQQLIGSHFGVPGLSAQYDYIVLGGGTGGLAMARRLASETNCTVAVVEAGDFYEFANGNFTQIPAFASQFIGSNPTSFNPYLDWYQYTSRQTQLADRIILYPSGKVLGGGSARNFMWFHRAPTGALKKWADLTGDNSYLFDNFLPFYEKLARFTPPDGAVRLANSTTLYDESQYSAVGGPVQVGYPNWVNAISSWIALGLEALGLTEVPGFSDGNIFGYAYTGFSIDAQTQTRSSSETSYLREALLETTNLNVYKNTLAKRILFDEDKNAIGAVVESGGLEYQLSATKEVIVSAGWVRSPQILMVSGIGPSETLESLGINVISDLPGVGQNMWDHIAFSPAYAVNVLTHSRLAVPEVFEEHAALYRENRTGMLTNCGGDILGFAKLPPGSISNGTQADLDAFSTNWPHIEHLFLDAYFGYANSSDSAPNDGRNYVSSSAALTMPFSRGNVTIVSNDTNDYPSISPNWLLDPRDQEMAVAAFKQARLVFTQNVMRPVVIGQEEFPGLNVSSDAEILELIRASAAASYHGSCTCAMGLDSDPMAVLDSRAKVYGVQRLRVVDASAFPVLPPGHPSQTVYALAEKIANDILVGS